MVLLSGDITGLLELFKETGSMIAGVGFVCAGLAVIKKSIANPERMYNAIITYVIALIVYILIVSLI